MSSRMLPLPQPAMLPGMLAGLLLTLVQALLLALVPADFNTLFVVLIALILLLYLLVPLLARLRHLRKAAPDDRRIGLRIGMICTSLITIAPIIVYYLSISGVRVQESGGFLDLRLFGDTLFSLVLLILLNAAGFLLALLGSRLGGVFGARGARQPKEAQ